MSTRRGGRSDGRRAHPPGRPLAVLSALVAVAAGAGCAGGPAPETRPVHEGWSQEGVASWYGGEFHGRPTASGERYDQEAMTAAHRSLPFGTWVRVENLDNGRRARLRITDRGPFVDDRILDVSRAAARRLGMIRPGTARVRVVVIRRAAEARCREVQVGSFRREANARALAARLRDRGAPAWLEPGPGGTTRVLLGPFAGDEEARRARRAHGGFIRACGAGDGRP